MMRRITLATGFVLAALSLAAGTRADEIKLKDGTKIVGTIVGFEDNSFKVKTSYGFAVVQKDQVASIIVSDGTKKPDVVAAKPAASAAGSAPPASSAPPPVKPDKIEHTAAGAPRPKPTEADSAADTIVEYPHTDTPPQPANSAAPTPRSGSQPSAAAVAAPPPPPKPATPEPMHEEVSGNTYKNDTYGFRMYKPPTWKVIDGARKILPGAITAMGTDDQTTYLLIGQETGGKSLASVMDVADKRLHDVMDNFRPLDEKRVTISGVSAIERRFRGSVDQHDWSGVVAYIPRGTSVYTIFGMTLADTDLVQIQENVISRAITSLQFTKQ
jgi:hypothetical protein